MKHSRVLFILKTSGSHGYKMLDMYKISPTCAIFQGREFDFRWHHWNFFGIIFRPHYGPEADSASNRKKYQEYFLRGKGCRCVGLTTLLSSFTDRLETWIYQPPGTLRACPGLHRDFIIKGNLQTLKIK